MRYEGVLSDATAHKLILITNSLHEHIALRDWTLSGAPDAIHSWEGGEGGSIFFWGGVNIVYRGNSGGKLFFNRV